MYDIKEGAWIQVQSNEYAQLRNGTVGYVEIVKEGHVSIRPTYHPDGKPFNKNNKLIGMEQVKLLPVELSEQDLDDLIDLALSDKDELTFNKLVNRRY